MKNLSKQEFDDLVAGASVLTKDLHGDKVYQRDDGLMIKLFRQKRALSSAAIVPYAQRFADNAAKLTRLGIATITVQDIYRCPEIDRTLVTYPMLEGHLLREELQQNYSDELLGQFSRFLAGLHARGIYFRSVHLGNVLLQADGQLALIDVADMSIRPWRLGLWKRLRNFAHLFKYREDQNILLTNGLEYFLTGYFNAANMSAITRSIFKALLKQKYPLPGQ